MPGEEIRENNSKTDQDANSIGKITPELVRQVAERVYKMLRDDLQLEQERARIGSSVQTGGFGR